MLVDQKNGDTYIPLNNLVDDQNGFIEVCNSILSEEAVLVLNYSLYKNQSIFLESNRALNMVSV